MLIVVGRHSCIIWRLRLHEEHRRSGLLGGISVARHGPEAFRTWVIMLKFVCTHQITESFAFGGKIVLTGRKPVDKRRFWEDICLNNTRKSILSSPTAFFPNRRAPCPQRPTMHVY